MRFKKTNKNILNSTTLKYDLGTINKAEVEELEKMARGKSRPYRITTKMEVYSS